MTGSAVSNPLEPSALPDSYFPNSGQTAYLQNLQSTWDHSSPMPDEQTLLAIGKSACSMWHNGADPNRVQQTLMDAFGPINGTGIAIDAGHLCIQDWTP